MSDPTLHAVLDELREQLAAAQKTTDEAFFNIEKVTVELALVVSKAAKSEAKIELKVPVISIGGSGGGEAKRETSHRITLTLLPVQKMQVSGEVPFDPTRACPDAGSEHSG
jgi:hypothetical protein